MSVGSDRPLPPYICTLIQITARKMIGSCRLNRSDQEELEQQISFEVVRRRGKFDPAKAQENTFLARLVEHAVADILTARKASNRDYRREEGSLDRWVKDSDNRWVRWVETITEEAAGQRAGRSAALSEESRDLAIEMAAVVAQLPQRLQRIVELLQLHGSVQAVAETTGLHRSSIYDSLKQIRNHFENAGLDDYLPSRFSNPTDSRHRR